MQKIDESKLLPATQARGERASALLPVTAIVPVRNEERNLPRCLQSLKNVDEVYVVDSQSTDTTVEIARSFGAKVAQFHYKGGWPKKRQWAMDSLPLAHDWILLIDADEALTPQLEEEIKRAIDGRKFDGYRIALRMHFLGRELRHCGASFFKLSLFRRGKGHYECRLMDQDSSMADMEIHEHVVVEGATAELRYPLLHHNVESLSRYIRKHDEYSNWEARVWLKGEATRTRGSIQLEPSLFGSQPERRRWLRKMFFAIPGSPLIFFLYKYLVCLGFLDGVPGLIFCVFQGIQFFHIKAKIYELKMRASSTGFNKD
jgi:glycosyltransferase involved in cell wall biosynthesis